MTDQLDRYIIERQIDSGGMATLDARSVCADP